MLESAFAATWKPCVSQIGYGVNPSPAGVWSGLLSHKKTMAPERARLDIRSVIHDHLRDRLVCRFRLQMNAPKIDTSYRTGDEAIRF